MRLVAIDFETANNMPESACSIGVSVYEDGMEVDSYSTLIKPLKKHGHFDWRAVRIHNIKSEDVVDAPSFLTVYKYLTKYFFDSIFVAHNAEFDMRVFKKCCEAYNLPVPNLKFFCTVKLARRIYPYLERHKLNSCCEYMGIELNHHDALSDASACACIVVNTMVLFEEFDLEKFLIASNTPLSFLNAKK